MARILFVCTGNACRSPMAEGLARHLGHEAESAGVMAAGVHPRAVEVMRELGIDISGHRSRSVREAAASYEYVITLCDFAQSVHLKETEATVARLHWPVDDPIEATGSLEEIRQAFRTTRDEIADLIATKLPR